MDKSGLDSGVTTMIGEPVQGKAQATEAALLTSEQSWTLCGLSKSAWYKYLASGKIPRPVKIGSLLRWRKNELAAWIAAGCPCRAKWDAMIGKK